MSDQEKTEKLVINAVNGSTAVGSISVGGDIGGDINIGNTGYTADQVSILITQIQSTFQPKSFDGRCPYKGLDVFEEEDAELFFGREKLVNDLVSRVKESRTVFVTGPSGSGKSSLVRAGLIHALKQGAIKGSDRWLYATMKPGRDPIGELGRVVSSLASSTNPEDEIRAKALKDATIFARWCEIVLKEGRDKRLVLFIDQFEEVFTQINNEEERVAFLNLLTHAATIENGRVIILFSMRSDFVSNCATYPQLNALLNQQFVQIGAMQPEELVSAIAQPALRVGLRIDPDLIAQIINEMKGEPGALPLMQFALKDLFDSQQEKSGVPALILNDYLQRGGIHKALERHADDSFSKLSKIEQELARSIFSGLIEIGRGTQDTKRTALFDELVPVNTKAEDVEAIVQKLADARLVTTDEAAGKDIVTISHEKLIDAWPWLRKLVNENRDAIALQNEIVADAKEWDKRKRDASYLYAGGRLANVREQLEKQKFTLGYLAQEFVRTGRVRQQRSRRALFSAISMVVILSILASIVFRSQAQQNIEIAKTAQAASTLAFNNAEQAQRQTNIAIARQFTAQAQSMLSTGHSRQIPTILLAIQSMHISPTGDAAQILQTNTLAKTIATMSHDSNVFSVTFSFDDKLVASAGDKTARVWEAATGKEISHMTHDSYVTTVAFSPDGKHVASTGCDKVFSDRCMQGSARLWEATTGKEIARLTHNDDISSAAFSPDGNYLVLGGWNFTIIWEIGTGKEIIQTSYTGGVVAFSPNGKYVISGGDNIARIWEAATGKEIAHMAHDTAVYSVAFSPDGNYIVSGGDNSARVWEAATGKEIARMTHDSRVYSVAFSPDGKYVISGGCDQGVSSCSQGSARIWVAATGKEIARMTHDGAVNSVAFNLDGSYAVSGGGGSAQVWETDTGREVASMTYSGGTVAFSSDGMYVISGGCDQVISEICVQGSAHVWEARTQKEISHITYESFTTFSKFSPDGKYIVSGGCNQGDSESCSQGSARVWEVTTGKEISHMTAIGTVYSSAFSPDGKYVVSDAGNSAQVWEVATGKEIAHMTYSGIVESAVFSPNGKYVVSGGCDQESVVCDQGSARVWEAATGKEITRMTHKGIVSSTIFSPDGMYVASGGSDNYISIWEVTTGKEITHMTHDLYISSLAFSPDGRYIASGSWDNTARVWDASTGKEIARITHEDTVVSVVFSPNGKYVVSGSSDNTARIWEAATGTEIARMTHEGTVSSVAFSPDGQLVVSGGDNTARVWEVSTGNEIARTTYEAVSSVAFSPDGRFVLSGGGKTARVWIYRPDDLITEACSHLPRNLTYAEWQKYIGVALPYQAVCPNLPLDLEYFMAIAKNILSNANDPNPVKTALDKVQAELIMDATIKDYYSESLSIVSAVTEDKILSAVGKGDIKKALALFDQAAQTQVQVTIEEKYTLNNLCWQGSLQGFAEQVLQYCESAVKLSPENANIHDSRGVARALAGNFEGALLDFQYYVDHSTDSILIEQRRQWVEQLKKGINPFTPEVLESLKSQ